MRDWLSKNGQAAATAVSALLAALSFLVPAGLPARWMATAVLIATLPFLWSACSNLATSRLDARHSRWRAKAQESLPYLAVVAGTLAALGPISLGDMPVSQDHANHYLATSILVHDMIPSGRLFGWTDRLGAGYPFGDLYPSLCYLTTGLLHLVSFGAIGLGASYAFGIAITWIVPALGTVALARRIAGRWGAVLAGLAFAVDAGGDREGGWTYSMFHGVWPQQLGLGVWIFALLALWRLGEKPTTRRLAAAALLAGLCLWIHPMNSLTLLIASLGILAVRLVDREQIGTPSDPKGIVALIFALLGGATIGLAWVVRMILARSSVTTLPVYWKQLPVLMGQALDGALFDNQLVFVSVLALIGLIHAIREGGSFRRFAVLLPAALLLLGAMDLFLAFDLGLLSGKLRTLQFRRFSIPIKPFWFAFAGAGLSAVGRGIAVGVANRARNSSDTLWMKALLALVLAPCLYSAVEAAPGLFKSPSLRPLTLELSGEEKNVKEMKRILDDEAKRLGNAIHRAVYWERPGYGGRYPMIAIADAGFGFLPTKFTPAQNFSRIAFTTDVDMMHRLGASMIISRWPVENDSVEEVSRLGVHRLFRFTAPPASPVELQGPGSVKVLSWRDEERTVEVSGTGGGATLVFAFSYYDKWRAVQAGKSLEIDAYSINGVALTAVSGVGDGEVRLIYRDRAGEYAASAAGLIVFIACLIGLVVKPRPLNWPWSAERARLFHKIVGAALGALLVGGVTTAVVVGNAAANSEWLSKEPSGSSIEEVLHRQEPTRFSFDPGYSCVKPHTRDPAWGCVESDLEPRLAPGSVRAEKVPSCILVGLPPGPVRAEIEFALPAGANLLKGRLSLQKGGSEPRYEIRFDDSKSEISFKTITSRSKTFRAAIPDGAKSATFVISSQDVSPVAWQGDEPSGPGPNDKSGAIQRVCIEAVAIKIP